MEEEEEQQRTSKTFERSASMAGVEPGASRLSFSLDNHSWSTVWTPGGRGGELPTRGDDTDLSRSKHVGWEGWRRQRLAECLPSPRKSPAAARLQPRAA